MTRVRRWLVAYIVAVLVFAVVDGIWISLVANRVYRSQIGPLLAEQFVAPVAVVFYLGYVAGLVHFGIRPLDRDRRLLHRLGSAAVYGACTYGTWALTGWAVLRGFPAVVALTDIAWGVVICTLVTGVTAAFLFRSGPGAESAVS